MMKSPAKVLNAVDASMFELYRNGAELHVWRNSSPHNWWLSEPGDSNADMAHFEPGDRPTEAYFLFGRRVMASGDTVSYRGFKAGFDNGQAVHETWTYDETAYKAYCLRYDAERSACHNAS